MLEDNLLQKYDEMLLLLDDEDLKIAFKYRRLMIKVLPIINKYKRINLEITQFKKTLEELKLTILMID